MRSWLRFGCLALLAGGLWAQDDTPVFRTGVKVVSVLATARTAKGQFVKDLGQGDFTLTENGRPQKIEYFSRETDLPLTLGLLIDTSMSQEKVISAERAASFRFLDRVLRPRQDLVFLMQFDAGVFLRQKPTDSRAELEQVLSLIDTPSRKELEIQGAGTRMYDAIVKASGEQMAKREGRKALILLTDGVDVRSDATLAEAVEAALRSDTVVYSILFSAPGAYLMPGEAETGRHALSRLALETGGSFFEVSKKMGIEQVFSAIEEELRSEYSIGFVSDTPVRVHEWRKLKLTVGRKDLRVQARERYWAQR